MKKSKMCILCSIVCVLFLIPLRMTEATELIWVPINPSFGGSPYNASWLMASAQTQNKHVEKSSSYRSSDVDALTDFENRLNSQLLYVLSRKIVDEAFGEEGLLPEGETEVQYSVGNYSIGISTDLTNITVLLIDTSTGSSTSVAVPYF